MSSWKQRGFVSFDCETTGLSETARVIELGLVLFDGDGRVVDRFSSLINPGPGFNWDDPGVKKALEVNGLTVSQIVGCNPVINEQGVDDGFPTAPSFGEVWERIPAAYWQAGCWVAHNAQFDVKMLMRECSLLGVAFEPPPVFCSQMLEAFLCPEVKGWKLVEVAGRRGIEFEGDAHRADVDAKVCGDIFMQMIDQLPDDIEGAVSQMREAEQAWQKRWGRGGYDHKPVAKTAPDHLCHAYGCEKMIKPELLCCAEHWRMVPDVIQKEVWAAYRRGQEQDKKPSIDWLIAADRASIAIAQAENQPREVLADLNRRLDKALRTRTARIINESANLLRTKDPDPHQLSEYGRVRLYSDGLRDGVSFVPFSEKKARFGSYRFGYVQGLSIQAQLTMNVALEARCKDWVAYSLPFDPSEVIASDVPGGDRDDGVAADDGTVVQ